MIDRRVACFPADLPTAARLRGALRGTATLVPCNRYADLVNAIQVGEVCATLIVVEALTMDTSVSCLRRLRADFATHALIAYCDFRELSSPQLLQIAQAGVTSLALRDVDDLQHVLGPMLLAAEQSTLAQVLGNRFAHQVPGPLRAVFRYALEHAGEPINVAGVSAALGVNRRTLAYRLAGYGFPSPRIFLTWCRLLVVGELLDERGRTLDSVAEQLAFSCGHTLGVIIQRYLGRGVAALRTDSVRDAVMTAFLDAINAAPATPRSRDGDASAQSTSGDTADTAGRVLPMAGRRSTPVATARP